MTALVTGASGGLGRVVARRAGRGRPRRRRALPRRRRRAPRPRSPTSRRPGRRAAALHADLDGRRRRRTRRARATTSSTPAPPAVGAPDVVVLNAFPQDHVAWADLDTAAWDAFHRGGLRPTTALLHRAAARLGAGGVVVVVGSIEGLRPAPTHAPYAVAKAALHHLTAAAASELGARGIRVVAVAPGLVDAGRAGGGVARGGRALASGLGPRPAGDAPRRWRRRSPSSPHPPHQASRAPPSPSTRAGRRRPVGDSRQCGGCAISSPRPLWRGNDPDNDTRGADRRGTATGLSICTSDPISKENFHEVHALPGRRACGARPRPCGLWRQHRQLRHPRRHRLDCGRCARG